MRGTGIGMIFQDSMTSLNPVKTIGKQLDEAFIVHHSCDKNEAKNRSIEMLTKVGIPSPEKRYGEYPHQLSGGMRQRVMIAMALAQNPSLIIADEPTTALDVTIQAQIMELMKEMKEKTGVSIMLITHDMGVVAEMADKIMVMYAGMVIEYATAREIFKDPKHPYTKGLLASIPRKDKDIDRLYTIEGTVPSLTSMPKGCRFCDRCTCAMEKCRNEQPPMYQFGERSVRCFLYEDKGGVSMKDNVILEVKNVEKFFYGNKKLFQKDRPVVKAVNDVSFTINEGETFGIVGESGCGKSTLGRTVIRLLNPTSGQVLYKGTDLQLFPVKRCVAAPGDPDHFPGSLCILKPKNDSQRADPGSS